MKIRIAAVAIACVVVGACFAAPLRAAASESALVSIWDTDASIMLDASQRETIDTIASARARFVSVRDFSPAIRPTLAVAQIYWFRFERTRPWRGHYLAVDMHDDDAELFTERAGSIVSMRFGMLVPYAARPISRIVPTVAIPNDADADAAMYVRVAVHDDRGPIVLGVPAAFAAYDAAERQRLVYPLIVGLSICFAFAVGNAVVYVLLRSTTLLLYSLTMLSAVLLGLVGRPGLAWAWLWPYASISMHAPYTIVLFVYYAAVVAFGRKFLDFSRLNPWYGRSIIIAYVAYVLIEVFSGFFPSGDPRSPREIILSVNDIAILSLILASGIAALRSGQSNARFYVFAFSGVLIGISADQVASFVPAFYQQSIVLSFAGIAWEGTMLFAALADTVNVANRAHLAANEGRVAAQQALVEQARQYSEQSEYAAMHDDLTGLSNRRQIELEIARIGDDRTLACALAYIDLDHFKVVNDTFGHAIGDRMLIAVTQQLVAALPEGDSLARIGGDEFLILMRGADLDAMVARAEDIRAAIASARFAIDANPITLSASIGLALVDRGEPIPNSLLGLADAACADAKEAGRNRVHTTRADLDSTRTRSDMDWVSRITRAFDDGRFRLYAQPIVRIDGGPTGLRIEALVRMVDGAGEMIEPSHFLPSAERYGLMPRVDVWVITEALHRCADAALEGTLQSLSINLSGAFLRRPDALRSVQRAIEESGFPPERLCFEITETVVASSLGDVTVLIDVLGARGVRFALDDFGTGTSSLSLLKRLEVDFVKIDGSFVRECASDLVDAAIVESIASLAAILNIETVAEYVVDAATVTRVRELGITYGQGWAFDRARPIGELLSARIEQ